jgi:hypothetical protein
MGYVRLKPRKWPVNQDEDSRNEFKERIHNIRVVPGIDIWFYDETGFEGDPVPRRIICHKGERARIYYLGSHVRASILGAVRPRDGKFVSLIMPFVDTEIFQCFIYEFNKAVDRNKKNIVILDNAKWHKTERLEWGIVEPLYLPTYSPDLNPIEELWLSIKSKFFSWFWAKSGNELDDHIEEALKYYIARPYLVKSICSMKTFD